MRQRFPLDWRTQHRGKKRFYARYMRWLERGGYLVVALIFAAFIFAFTFPMEDALTAEKAVIEPYATPVKATDVATVVEFLVADGAAVAKDTPVAQVVVGEEAVARYLASQTLLAAGLKSDLPLQTFQTVRSGAAGVIRLNHELVGKRLDSDAELFRTVNFDDLRITASLSGATVAQAKVGALVTIGPVVVAPANGVLLRGKTSEGSVISGDLLGADVREEATKDLANLHLQPRDDLELSIQEVTELLVDAELQTKTVGASASLSEPDSNATFKGEVISGSHSATVQLSDLPADAAAKLAKLVQERLKGKTIGIDAQKAVEVQDASNIKIVAKAKAAIAESTSGAALPATALSRGFDAQIKVVEPSAHLISLVRLAADQGRAVTARVKVRTGQRPLAFLLLKRS